MNECLFEIFQKSERIKVLPLHLQIIKILHLYTPLNEFEERVPVSFIRKIQEKLSGNTKDSSQSLLMDTKFVYAITFKFSPSSLALETVSAPDEWSLGVLKKI